MGMDVMQLSRTDFFCGCDAIDATQSTHVSLWLVSSSVTAGYNSSFSFLPEYPTPFLLILLLLLVFLFFICWGLPPFMGPSSSAAGGFRRNLQELNSGEFF